MPEEVTEQSQVCTSQRSRKAVWVEHSTLFVLQQDTGVSLETGIAIFWGSSPVTNTAVPLETINTVSAPILVQAVILFPDPLL